VFFIPNSYYSMRSVLGWPEVRWYRGFREPRGDVVVGRRFL